MMDKFEYLIRNFIPQEISTVLDIGSGKKSKFKKKYDVTTIDLKEADICLDLDKTTKIPLASKKYDLIILSHILEHLSSVEKVIKEATRLSKKWIIIGLPNELTLGNRIRYLRGSPTYAGYIPLGHKHFFTIDTIEDFICSFFKTYRSKLYFFGEGKNANKIPERLKKTLANLFPKLFAREVYYLIDINENRKTI
jgi:hypothetical protein